jgi:hypothetical protein
MARGSNSPSPDWRAIGFSLLHAKIREKSLRPPFVAMLSEESREPGEKAKRRSRHEPPIGPGS